METKYANPCERAPRKNSPKMRGFLIGQQPRLSSPTYYPCPSAVSTAWFEVLFLSSYNQLQTPWGKSPSIDMPSTKTP